MYFGIGIVRIPHNPPAKCSNHLISLSVQQNVAVFLQDAVNKEYSTLRLLGDHNLREGEGNVLSLSYLGLFRVQSRM